MSRRRPSTRAGLIALTMTAFVGTAPLLVAQQTIPTPPPAQPGSGPDSQGIRRQDPGPARSKAKAKSSTGRPAKGRVRRDAPGFYMGRPIAGVMSWEGVDWLFRATRIEEEQPEAMLNALKIPRGATVADVGAGAGYHSIRLARRVGPKGTVFATDIQPEMLRMLRANARTA